MFQSCQHGRPPSAKCYDCLLKLMRRRDVQHRQEVARLEREVQRLRRRLERQEITYEQAPSFVYFVRREADGWIKIGTSRSVPQRLADLKVAAGKITPLAVLPGDRAVERFLHLHLGEYRKDGEWFLPAADVRLAVNRARRLLREADPDRIGYKDVALADMLAVAERVGFEPTALLRTQRLSRAPESATLAPLRGRR